MNTLAKRKSKKIVAPEKAREPEKSKRQSKRISEINFGKMMNNTKRHKVLVSEYFPCKPINPKRTIQSSSLLVISPSLSPASGRLMESHPMLLGSEERKQISALLSQETPRDTALS